MIIHSPIFSGSISQDSNHAYANLSGSFTGSFTGIGNFTGLEADSVEFDNILNKPALVSGSQQVIDLLPTGVVSGSTQLTTELDARYLNTSGDGIVSGSSQITLSSTTGYSSFSSSLDSRISTEKGRIDAILSSADANADTFAEIVTLINSVDTTNDNAFASFYTSSNATDVAQNARLTSIESVTGSYETKGSGIVSGSAQVTPLLPTGVVSGSSQINLASVTGNTTSNVTEGTNLYYTDARVKTKLDADGVISGSSQLTTEFDARYLNTLGDGIVSGSKQVKDLLPTGTISGSSQVNADSITNFDANVLVYNNSLGLVSGSSQINLASVTDNNTSNVSEGSNLYYTDARVKTKLTSEGVISGSVQILGGTGIVSGSSQIDVTATTNYSTISSHISDTSNPHSVTATQVGLGNVTNESKATMFTSPTFTGTPIAPTAASNTNSTQIATTAYVQQELTDLIGGASAAFDTLLEISASLASGDSTLNTLVDGKLAKSSNLSDLTDASTARTNLGLAIGTNVQAYNSTLASVAGGTYSGDDSITTIGTVTAGSVTAILPTGTISGSSQIAHDSTTGFVANKHIDHTAVSITAGNGLTGGGDISSTRTINVVGGNGITVNADNIELAGTYTGTWAVTGGITATADVVAYSASDRRLKDNIQNIENPIEKVQQLNGVTWDWNDNATELQKSIANVGVIAQEVEVVLPQLIQHRDTGYLAVDYAKLTGLLIEAIKEQQKQIDELKSKLQ